MLNFQQKVIFLKKYSEILKKCPLFDGVTDEELLEMLGCLSAKTGVFSKGETIISEGEPAKYIGIVLSGTVRIERVDYYGNKSIIGNVECGELFAESYACAGIEKMPVSVVSADDCRIMFLDCGRVIHTCDNSCGFHGRIIFNLMKIIANKNLVLNQKCEITSKRTTREKLLAYLLVQAKKHNSQSFEIPFDRQSLADFLEVDRSGLSAEISKMRAEGIIECRKNYFKVQGGI